MPNQAMSNVSAALQEQLKEKATFLNIDLGMPSWMVSMAILTAILSISLIAYYVIRFALVRTMKRLSENKDYLFTRIALQAKVAHRFAMLVPGFIIYATVHAIDVPTLPITHQVANAISLLASIYLIIILTLIASGMLTAIDRRYQYFQIAKQYSIKSYIQITKIALFGLAGVFVVSFLLGKSPTYFLTGLGAMTAVLMLVFRDSILGFVASIQLSAYDMVRIDDWIELPSYGADGNVIDISLNTIKIQNFDKTIVTIPSYALLTSGVKNWRGMSEAGGRRIKRSILIDVNSIRLCDKSMLSHYKQLPIISDRLSNELTKIKNMMQLSVSPLLKNGEVCLSNLTVFRMYLEEYLKQHPKSHAHMTFIIRELESTGKGLPVEIYMFSDDVDWVRYEQFQADIFDYIYSILPLFHLKPFQHLSGSSLQLATNSATMMEESYSG